MEGRENFRARAKKSAGGEKFIEGGKKMRGCAKKGHHKKFWKIWLKKVS